MVVGARRRLRDGCRCVYGVHSHAYQSACTHAYGFTHAYARTQRDAEPCSYPGTVTSADPLAHGRSHRNADSDGDANAHGRSHRHADPDCDATPHSHALASRAHLHEPGGQP